MIIQSMTAVANVDWYQSVPHVCFPLSNKLEEVLG